MLIRADMHIHSPFSGGAGSDYTLMDYVDVARRKGLHLLGSGDAHVSEWVAPLVQDDGGVYHVEGIAVVATLEVEDNAGVHHLAIFPSKEHASEFALRVSRYGHNVMGDGRPTIHLPGAEIYEILRDYDAIVGPAHAFTPFKSVYGKFRSIRHWLKRWDFVELGLSADARMASGIGEISRSTFVAFSDAHSPSPHRLGREYVEMKVSDLTYDDIRRAISRGNVVCYGIPPELGKYHLTACTSCGRRYGVDEARGAGFSCPCGGRIAMGVRDRVAELSDRAPREGGYVYNIPLPQLLEAAGLSPSLWWKLTEEMSEHHILHLTPPEEIEKKLGRKISRLVRAFREREYAISPGGGGMYGSLSLPAELDFPLSSDT